MITEKKFNAWINDAKAYITEQIEETPVLGIILGSG
jgi:purine nucleoside phosphorylase